MHFNPAAGRRKLWALGTLLIGLVGLVIAGQVLAQSNDSAEVITPTATATVTPSVTSTPTITASPTSTVTPTSTISPTVMISATETATATWTATPSPTATQTPSPTATPQVTLPFSRFLPALFSPSAEPLSSPIRVTGAPPIDFDAARQEAQQLGRDVAFNKIGFHVGVGGNRQGLDDWMVALDSAGVPLVLKTANDAEPLFKAQELMKQSGVPHVLIYRDARHEIDNPAYNLPPQQAAALSWQANTGVFPPELDPSLVWMETVNEPDKNRATWLAEFSLASAQMAVADGYKYAAFGWSSGEPEPEDWESPEMLAFLEYAADHPDQVAVALHEYSFQTELVSDGYPWLLGRFQKLFEVCDEHGIARPTVLITEWGWEYNRVPEVSEGMDDIAWASWLYADFPQILGAAIWYLGPGFSDIDDQTQKYIEPVTDYSLSNYFIYDPQQRPIDENIYAPNPPTFNQRKIE